MSNSEDLKAINEALEQWLVNLDKGNLQGMLDTCDPEVITVNEKTPTTVGVEHVREKYAPLIEMATFKSSFEVEHQVVYENFAMIIGSFDVKMTNKNNGEVGGGSGRLALGYRRHADGSWKMVFDMDNNA